jgi:hypothetical protein
MTDQTLDIRIAQTLHELQFLNPDLYGIRYTQLYSNEGLANPQAWTETMLQQIEQDLINNS